MRKCIALFIIVIIISTFFGALCVSAEQYEGLEYSVSNGEITITGCYSPITEIPDEINGYPVTKIAERAFQSKPFLQSIIIPKSVTSIGAYAFLGSGLTDVTIFANITTIETYTFANCSALEKIVIPKSVQLIRDRAFYNCNNIDTVEYEGSENEWNAIQKQGGNNGLTNASNFTYNSSLFNTCGEKLAWIISDDGILTISGSGNMTDYESAEAVPWYSQREDITGLVIGEKVTSIGNYAFSHCTDLTELNIGPAVTYIGKCAFEECKGLKSVFIPYSVKEIKDSAFTQSFEINSVKYEYGEEAWDEIQIADGNDDIRRDIEFYYEKSGSCGEDVRWRLSADGVLSIEGDGNMSDYESAEDTPWYAFKDNIVAVTVSESVRKIGAYAFSSLENITELEIHCNEIGDYAFRKCTNLERISLPDEAAIIGEGAFYKCESLTDISVPSGLDVIPDNLFYGCESLTGITIPENVTSIGKNAFNGCKGLENVVIPNSVTSIDDGAFSGCESITEIDIPHGITRICNDLFSGCISLKRIDIPDTVTSIGGSAFDLCRSLENLDIPDGVITISDSAFSGCESLEEINIPAGVTQISNRLLYGCKNLTDITIPNGVTSIGDEAFMDCDSLTVINIPAGVTAIGSCAFSARGLTNINVDNGNTNYSSVDGILFNKNKTMLIQYALGETNTDYVVPNSVTSICAKAFSGCEGLTHITVPDGITIIGERAFENCTGLISITIPDSVTEIGECLLGGCSSLTTAEIGNGVTSIKADMFRGCNNLKEIKIGNGVASVEYNAFSECQSLESIALPDGLTSIGERAFEGCDSLISITVPDNVTEIGEYAFASCDGLISATISDSVTNVGSGVFSECRSLTNVTFPHNINTIDGSAFGGCENIKIVYYNGTPAEWNRVEGRDHMELHDAKKKFVVWVTFVDNDGNTLYKAKNGLGDPIYLYIVPVQDDHHVRLYNDRALTERFLEDTELTENITLYIEKMNGTKTLVSDSEEIVDEKAVFTIKGIHVQEGKHVILALYDNDRFVGFQNAKYHKGDIVFKTDVPFTDAKVMVWDDLGMLRPAHEAENIEVGKNNQ